MRKRIIYLFYFMTTMWVKATAGNVVKELFAKRAYEFGDIVNVIWSSS